MGADAPIQHFGFTFRAMGDANLRRLTSKKLNCGSALSPADYQQDVAHFRGALLHLFGRPVTQSTLSDESFEYIIEARDEQGHVWILTAYSGASGPAIGGKLFDETVPPVAQALASLIRVTSPDDVDATVYDEDLDWTITYGVRTGEYFYQEVRGNHIPSKSSDAEQ